MRRLMADALDELAAEFRRRETSGPGLSVEVAAGAPDRKMPADHIESISVRFPSRLGGEFVVMKVGRGGAVFRAYLNEKARESGTPGSLRSKLALDLYRGRIVEGREIETVAQIADRLIEESERLGSMAEEYVTWD
jgi:hypothetical protein